MYVSMTGFGRAEEEREWGRLTLELSSVNHRYQEISVRLPREFATMEPWFHQCLRGAFRRGKLQARLEVAWAASSVAAVINTDVMSDYYRQIADFRGAIGMRADISPDALLNLPGSLDAPGKMSLGDDAETILSGLIDSATKNWNRMRQSEGDHLKDAIESHMADVERFMAEIGRMWPEARDAAFETMTARVTAALSSVGIPPDDSRFAQEAVILADKWDVAEEIARMASHIAKFRETGESGAPEGRKLDFIVQEMNREANTISSKVSSADIRWMAVEVKTSIERVREQIQNLE